MKCLMWLAAVAICMSATAGTLPVKLFSSCTFPGLDLGLSGDFARLSGGGEISWRILDADGRIAATGVIGCPSAKSAVIPAAGLKPGEYRLQLEQSSGDTAELEFTRVISPVAFRNRRFLVNDEEFFPLGVYLPWPAEVDGAVISEQSASQWLRDLPRIAEAGFNFVTISAPPHYRTESDRVLTLAQELGLPCFVAAAPQDYSELAVRYPGILGFLGPDEPELNPDAANFTPAALAGDYAERKRHYPNLPILVTHSRPQAFDAYIGTRDLAMTDPYTFGEEYHDINRVEHFVRELRRSSSEALPCIAILQMYQLPGNVMRLPNPVEMRCQLFLAAALGADGILLYTTATQETAGFHVIDAPEGHALWDSFPETLRELRRWLPLYRQRPLAESAPLAGALYWQLNCDGDRRILTLINKSDAPVSTAALSLEFGRPLPAELAPYQVVILSEEGVAP